MLYLPTCSRYLCSQDIKGLRLQRRNLFSHWQHGQRASNTANAISDMISTPTASENSSFPLCVIAVQCFPFTECRASSSFPDFLGIRYWKGRALKWSQLSIKMLLRWPRTTLCRERKGVTIGGDGHEGPLWRRMAISTYMCDLCWCACRIGGSVMMTISPRIWAFAASRTAAENGETLLLTFLILTRYLGKLLILQLY